MTTTTRESATARRVRLNRLLFDAIPLWKRQRITLRFRRSDVEGDFLHEMKVDTIGGLAVHPTIIACLTGEGKPDTTEHIWYWSVSHISSGRALAEYLDDDRTDDGERLARLVALRAHTLCDWTQPREELQQRPDRKRIARQVRAWARDPWGPDHRWVERQRATTGERP